MKHVLVLLIFASFSKGIKYDGLKVKYGTTGDLADKEYFFTIPRTTAEAAGQGWLRTDRPGQPMQELQMYCPPGRAVCPLYATTGFVAGLQIAAPVESIEPALKPEEYFVKWSAPASDGEPARDFWTATQYYVTEESIKAGKNPTAENGSTLQEAGVWVNGLDGHLMKISPSEAEIKTTLFKKQNCVPNMGTHYYYNMSRQLGCDRQMLAWFPLITEGDLLGVGFQTFGAKPSVPKGHRDYFENIPREPRTVPLRAIPYAPECFLDNSQKYGRLSIHIYYISKPWELRCEAADSIEPALATEPPQPVTTSATAVTAAMSGANKRDQIQKFHLVVLVVAWLTVYLYC